MTTFLCFVAVVIATTANASTGAEATLPVIDISSFPQGSPEARQAIAHEVDRAFIDFGFAVIVGHGVADRFFDDAHAAAKEFFQLPMSAKLDFDVGKGYGYGGYVHKMETGGKLTGETASKSDGVESLTLRGLQHMPASDSVCMTGSLDAHFAQDMSDVPRADAVPCSPSSLLSSVTRLHNALFDFKDTMTTITEQALGVSPGDFHKFLNPAKGGLRFAYYPERAAADDGVHNIDYGAHADSGSMVFLRLDRENPEGTEVFHKGEWLPVPHIPGGVVVNLGTVLARLTGGRWQAAIHRATRKGLKERLSTVMGALVPNNDLTIECLPRICGSESGAHRQVSVKEYLDARVRLQRPEKSAEDADVVAFIDQLSA